ncbi:hypothetical protein SCHPADRAFT_1002797 [Schizopora paradoxa]|uniref:UDENN domain-containing protein n=1 Tax=Schizopora paradoxa TaxID=27342 RepID=A0A0H2RLB9_9AGAM|nr:hypothetical protein SCHPADRAFT_1002797 [Schizopora paradoxa]
MSSGLLLSSPSPSPRRQNFFEHDSDDDAVSQRSISLSSPTTSVQPSAAGQPGGWTMKESNTTPAEARAFDSESMDAGVFSASTSTRSEERKDVAAASTRPSSQSSSLLSPSNSDEGKSEIKYPPKAFRMDSDASSTASLSSSSSRKERPESCLMELPKGPLVPGVALVDFNHLVGPKIEFSEGTLFDDEQIASIMPFLALPDGAHLSAEDYSYFHLVPASPHPTTIFGISCNRQIKSADLLVKDEEVTRSTVQKAVVVLAAKPFFGPIRDKLGVVTRALFDQRDFRDMSILSDFKTSLELSLHTKLTESALYMGTNIRELVHKFRTRTLLLLKALILQKRIMFYGHPVERLCTYQYSLISLIPGLLQNLDDCGSPPLASRALTLSRASSLRTSDRKSMLAYQGLPLDIFGKDAFFQPYLPLQQVDLIKDTRSWLCGTTNTIVTQQNEIDLLINIETNTFEFKDPKLERLVALTAADRKWMDDIVKDVNEGWSESSSEQITGLKFKGSEDYLRSKFEDYVSSALSCVKYSDFLMKGTNADVLITGGVDGADVNGIQDFNPLWIAEFRKTNAFEVWNRITDPMLFDIIEARHPCVNKPNVVADIGLRLQEGIQDLRLDEQLAPTREVLSRTFAQGSTSFLKAVGGVRERWAQRSASSTSIGNEAGSSTASSTPVEISHSDLDSKEGRSRSSSQLSFFRAPTSLLSGSNTTTSPARSPSPNSQLKPLSTMSAATVATQAASETKATLNTWGASIGSFISQRTSRFSTVGPQTGSAESIAGMSEASAPPSSPPNKQASPEVNGQTIPEDASPSKSQPPIRESMASMFSSWNFGRSSVPASKPPDSTPMSPTNTNLSIGDSTPKVMEPALEEDSEELQPRNIGEFDAPPRRDSDDSSQTADEHVYAGMAL